MKKRLMVAGIAAVAATIGSATPAQAACVPAADYAVCALHAWDASEFGGRRGYALVGVFGPPYPGGPPAVPYVGVGEWTENYGEDWRMGVQALYGEAYIYDAGGNAGVSATLPVGPGPVRTRTPLPAPGPMPRP